jgi:4-hydroxybenzoate polyprenyltransferase
MVSVFLRVIRARNLVIVALTMYLMRFGIIQPVLHLSNLNLQLNELLFFLLTLSTVFITAGGYVINDYFDTKTDLVNRPQTVVVGRQLSRRSAIIMHWVLNSLGLVLGAIVSISIGKPLFTLGFIIIPGILWFYSTTYKRQFLVGNLVVAFLVGLVPAMPLIFELPPLYENYWSVVLLNPNIFNQLTYWIIGFSLFAFFINLFREIVKDIEDFEGDIEYGRNTLPVVLGFKTSRVVAASILLGVVIVIAYLFGAYLNYLPRTASFDYLTLTYIIGALIVPIFYMLIKLLSAERKEDYHYVSQLAKYIMLSGLLYSLVFRFFVA